MSTAAIYARQSMDRHGDGLAVTRQLALCRKFAAERGWDVSAEYIDNDRSATSGAERPEFERLLAARPERVVVWHTDRLVRLTRDLERVINLGVNVHAVEAGHVDLSNPAGRAVAKTITAWAQYEGEQKALRQRAANDQRAAAGLPYRCQRPFGYEPDGMAIREDEADELRAAARQVQQGVSLSAVVRDLNGRGVPTATGKTWRTTTLKAALLSPRNAGMRRHRGKVVGEAAWPAIFDQDTAAALRALLTDPARSQRGPSRRYLLSGVLTCGKCHGPVTGAFIKEAGKGPTYRCLGHVSRGAALVDDYVTRLVIARLSREDAVDLFARPGADPEQVAALRDERAGLRGRLSALAEAFAMGEIDRAALVAGTKRAQAQIEAVEAQLADSTADPTLADLVSADDVGTAYLELPQDVQRQVIDTLLTTLEMLPVGSGRGKGRLFNPETREWELNPESLSVEWRSA